MRPSCAFFNFRNDPGRTDSTYTLRAVQLTLSVMVDTAAGLRRARAVTLPPYTTVCSPSWLHSTHASTGKPPFAHYQPMVSMLRHVVTRSAFMSAADCSLVQHTKILRHHPPPSDPFNSSNNV